MQQSSFRSGPLRFGAFEADLHTGELTKRGKQVRLQEQPFRLLAMLLEKPGELVTREELRGRLWPQTIVDFDHGLNKAISKIRDALGDSAENPRFVETVAAAATGFLPTSRLSTMRARRSWELKPSLTATPDLFTLLSSARWQFGHHVPMLGDFTPSASPCSWPWQSPYHGASANGGAHPPRFAPWRSCLWRTLRATRRRNISPTA
jgi:DNA-binding winged helix-turn-helix (wHTH) protein